MPCLVHGFYEEKRDSERSHSCEFCLHEEHELVVQCLIVIRMLNITCGLLGTEGVIEKEKRSHKKDQF